MREEQRPAIRHPEWQLDVVVALAVEKPVTRCIAAVVNLRVDGITGRASRQHVGDQAFIPTADLVIQRPTLVGAPMPIEDLPSFQRVPVPLHFLPEPIDASAQRLFSSSVSIEILPCTEKPHAQERSLHQVTAVVLAEERNRGASSSVHKMCECAVVARCAKKQLDHPADAVDGGLTCYPATFCSKKKNQKPKTKTTKSGFVVRCSCARSTFI